MLKRLVLQSFMTPHKPGQRRKTAELQNSHYFWSLCQGISKSKVRPCEKSECRMRGKENEQVFVRLCVEQLKTTLQLLTGDWHQIIVREEVGTRLNYADCNSQYNH